jgi:DNA-binding LacI/PurR family transcriptional regulator
LPLVLISSNPGMNGLSCVFLNAFDALYKITDHLARIGRKRIAFIGGAKDSAISIDKYAGYKAALEDAGLPVLPGFAFYGERQHFSSGILGTSALLSLPEAPDGIICATDDIGVGCIKRLLQGKINIPGRIAVASFNGISMLKSYEPELTTVAQPIGKIAELAFQMLKAEMEGSSEARRRVEVKGDLVINTSTVRRWKNSNRIGG